MAGGKSLSGVVIGSIIEVRFAYSGKISSLRIHSGDLVKSGSPLAELDKKILQAELDKELADYERVRADFEIFVKKAGTAQDDFAKFEKVERQALLNSSVKSVEISKYRLDQTVMFSPVRGIVVDDGGLRVGIYATPGANPVKILDLDSLALSVPVSWEQINEFGSDIQFSVRIEDGEKSIPAALLPFIPTVGPKEKPELRFRISPDFPVYPTMSGVVEY
jgi:multidrug resistance efflux pump